MDRDMISYFQAVRGMSDPVEIKSFMDVLEREAGPVTVLEAGAGGGVMGMHAMQYHPESRAVMIEAHPAHFRATQLNIEKNGFSKRSHTILAAVGAEAGRVVKFTDEGYGSNIDSGGKFLAVQVAVDGIMMDLGLESLDILHMDVQGAEVNVLYGAEEALRQGRIRYVFIGTHSDGLHEMAKNYMEDCGFLIFTDLLPSESICSDGVLAAALKNNGAARQNPDPGTKRNKPDLNDFWIRKHYELLAEPFLARVRARDSLYLAIPMAWASGAVGLNGTADFNFDGGKVRMLLDVTGNFTTPSGRGRLAFQRCLALYNEIPKLYQGGGVLIFPLDYQDLIGSRDSLHINTKSLKAENLNLELINMADKRRWLLIKE